MSGRHQELNGADSQDYTMLQMDALQEPYVLGRYRVLVEDDDGGRQNVTIKAALGIKDAMNQARELRPYHTPLAAEEIVGHLYPLDPDAVLGFLDLLKGLHKDDEAALMAIESVRIFVVEITAPDEVAAA